MYKVKNILNEIYKFTDTNIKSQILKYQEYLLYEKGYSKHTVISYLYDIKIFFHFFHDKQLIDASFLNKLTPADIRNFLFQSNLQKNSIKRLFSSIRSLYAYLIQNDVVNNVAMMQIKPGKGDKNLPHPINYEDIQEIIRYFDHNICSTQSMYKTIFISMYGMGLRISEVIHLTLMDFLNMQYEKKIKIIGKGNKERVIPILEIVFEHIKQYLENKFTDNLENYIKNAPNAYIFSSKNDIHKTISVSSIQKNLKKTLTTLKMNSKFTPHSLRHSFASHLIENGAELRYVQELLGHNSPRSTQTYTHINTKSLIQQHKKTHPRGHE